MPVVLLWVVGQPTAFSNVPPPPSTTIPPRTHSGLHTLKVCASDSHGRTACKKHKFSVDGTVAPMPKFSQASTWICVAQGAFFVMHVFLLLPCVRVCPIPSG
jgi:hypothetical protein